MLRYASIFKKSSVFSKNRNFVSFSKENIFSRSLQKKLLFACLTTATAFTLVRAFSSLALAQEQEELLDDLKPEDLGKERVLGNLKESEETQGLEFQNQESQSEEEVEEEEPFSQEDSAKKKKRSTFCQVPDYRWRNGSCRCSNFNTQRGP
eukprot:TRINITY_DN13895_c0_g1_i1.p1 TRINITY_DN13895_c0_g1~~TRINITY_DN13895_c0_g1_i1.p1  ORF type:complete len:151 (+),score=18.59 TRINITY_DN13895_c0_g1_i1:1-453(+)